MENQKIVGYVRDTSNNKERLQKQMNEIIDFAKENYNSERENIDIFIDTEPISKNRQGFNQMMENIKQKKYNILLVTHINRLYRIYPDEKGQLDKKMLKEFNDIKNEIEQQGVSIISIKEQMAI